MADTPALVRTSGSYAAQSFGIAMELLHISSWIGLGWTLVLYPGSKHIDSMPSLWLFVSMNPMRSVPTLS